MYIKIKSGETFYEIICVYLPSETKHCLEVLKKIDKYIQTKNIKVFTLIGDTNINFSNPTHSTKIREFLKIVNKNHLFNLATHLNNPTKFSWRGRGARNTSFSLIDHCFTNVQGFNRMEYRFNSFSDHKTLIIGLKSKFIYRAPKWKKFLFKNSDFQELMKKESIMFLFDNADILSKNKECDHYMNNYSQIESDFTFLQPIYKESSVLFALLKHLKQVHDRFYSKLRLKTFKKTQEFDLKISHLFAELDNAKVDRTDEIKILTDQQQQYFKNLSYTRAETDYMRNLILDGNSNSYTFSHCRQKYDHEYKLEINGQITSSLPDIVNHLSKLHAEIVAPTNLPTSDLDSFLAEYDLSIDKIYPQIYYISSPKCTTSEYKEVIESMSNNSSPGISSEPKILFSFLFDTFPSFMTNAFNNIHSIKDIDKSPFAYIKDRNIISIPKKGADPKKGENRRPISSMETSYKILSKSLNKKVTPFLSKIISNDQQGFTPGRHMHTASISITAAMNYIKLHNLDCQFFSFDIKRAFDRIIPEVLHRILKHIFPNGNFAQAWINLTSKGRFRASAGGHFSKFISISLGTAQSGPSASTLFNILHHILPCILDSIIFKSIALKVNKNPLPAGAFCDDTWKFLCIKTPGDVDNLYNMLLRMEACTGLKMNFSKTKILIHGAMPVNLDKLGVIHSHLKHLGVYLSFNNNVGSQLTYDELLSNLDRKAMNFPLKSSYNILKRRNLCMSLLNSMCFHIFRVYSPNSEQIKKLWKVISKFLWSNKTDEGISYRYRVSEKRVELDFVNGGLKILKPEQQSFSIFIPSFLHIIHHAYLYPKSSLGILLAAKQTNTKLVLSNFGYKTFHNNIRCFKSLYPNCNNNYFNKILHFLKDLELNKSTFLQIPIISSHLLKNDLNSQEIQMLKDNDIVTIASILDHKVIGDRIMILPSLRKDILSIIPSTNLVEKLAIFTIQDSFPPLDTIKNNVFKKLSKPLIELSDFKPSILSLHYKLMHREKFQKQAPSIKTRISNGLYFPDIESFEISFKKIFSLPFVLYHKSFFFEQFSRTLLSRRKMCFFGHYDSTHCPLCKVDSSSEHALFYCSFPKYFIHSIAIFLDQYYNNKNPEFIFLKESFYLFNIFYEQFTLDEYFQISTIIFIAKDRSLKISKDDCLVRWSVSNYYSQSLFIAQFAIKLLERLGSKCNVITEFLNFLLKYQQNVSYFNNP